MRFPLPIALMILLAALAEYLLPWWSLAAATLAVAVAMRLAPGRAFGAGFIAIALLWAGWALWWDIPNDHLLSGRMAKVFSLPHYSLLLMVTVLIGAMIGGLGAWSGAHLRRLISVKKH